MNKLEVVLKNIADLGEGPIWDSKKSTLYFVDINGCKLCSYNYKNGEYNEISTPGRIGAAAMCENPDKFICAVENNLYILNAKSKEFTPSIENIFDSSDSKEVRFNDGKCDKNGRFYIGSTDFDDKNGNLYRVDKDKNIIVCEEKVACSNGIAFSGDNKYMYYIDTPSGFLWRYDYDFATGNIENKTALIDYRDIKGGFDGMTIDKDGTLWVAIWGGFAVNRYDAITGKKIDVVEVPAPNVTSCEFGGNNLNILFITTYGGNDINMRKEYPLAGSLFAVETDGASGLECNKFAFA